VDLPFHHAQPRSVARIFHLLAGCRAKVEVAHGQPWRPSLARFAKYFLEPQTADESAVFQCRHKPRARAYVLPSGFLLRLLLPDGRVWVFFDFFEIVISSKWRWTGWAGHDVTRQSARREEILVHVIDKETGRFAIERRFVHFIEVFFGQVGVSVVVDVW